MNGYKAILDAVEKRLENLITIFGYISDIDVENIIKEIDRKSILYNLFGKWK